MKHKENRPGEKILADVPELYALQKELDRLRVEAAERGDTLEQIAKNPHIQELEKKKRKLENEIGSHNEEMGFERRKDE